MILKNLTRFQVFFALAILLKLLIAALFPVIGDEAYYFYWGFHPGGGYYDHSPMIGWWESFFSYFSVSRFWLRLPNLLVEGLVSFSIYEWLAQSIDRERARLIAILFFISPFPFLAIVIAPDVPLVLFTFLSAFLFYQATTEEKSGTARLKFLFSGILWGAAFLSKYFAVLVLPAYLAYFIFRKFKLQSYLAIPVFILGALPFVFQHLYWNYTHCWANFVFNLVSRQKAYDGPLWQILLLLIVYLLIHSTPVLWRDLFRSAKSRSHLQLFSFLMWSVPMSLFGLTALAGKGQGLHWYLSYTPFFFIWVGLSLDMNVLRTRVRQMLAMTLSLAMLAVVLLSAPEKILGFYFKNHAPLSFEVAFHGHGWIEQFLPSIIGADALVTDGYTESSTLEYELKDYAQTHPELHVPPIGVWGDGSRFGRVFDWTFDFSALEGRRIVFISKGLLDTPRWKAYFSEMLPVEMHFGANGARYYVTTGVGFRATNYLKEVTRIAVDLYYPPILASVCPLRD